MYGIKLLSLMPRWRRLALPGFIFTIHKPTSMFIQSMVWTHHNVYEGGRATQGDRLNLRKSRTAGQKVDGSKKRVKLLWPRPTPSLQMCFCYAALKFKNKPILWSDFLIQFHKSIRNYTGQFCCVYLNDPCLSLWKRKRMNGVWEITKYRLPLPDLSC